jgi:hypothetical protein
MAGPLFSTSLRISATQALNSPQKSPAFSGRICDAICIQKNQKIYVKAQLKRSTHQLSYPSKQDLNLIDIGRDMERKPTLDSR